MSWGCRHGFERLGEGGADPPPYFSCLFRSLIADWRVNFNHSEAWFGFVVFEPFSGATSLWPAYRDAQLDALALPNTNYATMHDDGDPLSPWGDYV